MKITKITHEAKRVRHVTPKGAVRYKDEWVEILEEVDPYSFIVDRLDAGRIEDNIRQIREFVAALACKDTKRMADILDQGNYYGDAYKIEL